MAVVQEVESCSNFDVKSERRFKGDFSHDNFLDKESVILNKKVAKIAKRITNKASYV